MSNTPVGTIAHLWRFPVKSMQGERIDAATITERGIAGDRAYALIETDSGKVVSAKSVSKYPNLLSCRAEFVEPPKDGEIPAVRIVLPDGVTVTSDAANAAAVLSKFFGRAVTLARTAPADFTIDNQNADLETGDLSPAKPSQLGAALFEKLGVRSPVPAETFFDAFPLSLLTRSTLDRLNALRPQSRFDERRFRMNVIVATPASGFVENDWVKRTLQLGDSLQVRITMPDSRCVMTTLAQGELPRDVDVMRTLVAHNRIPAGGADPLPCAGVYARVTTAGTVRVGDPVTLT